ncbi:MAG: hypothetical protein K0S39_5561 [Paenibacillus sp.]|jgi:hypothetical protein|nr:hypothetical protein [Paenibacillus sp.]
MDKKTIERLESLESTIRSDDISAQSRKNDEYKDFTEELEKTAAETCSAGLDG